MTWTAPARRRAPRSVLASLALLGLAGSILTGCGGSSGQSAAPAGSPSSPAFSSPASSSPASPGSSGSGGVGPSAPAFASTSAGTPKDRVLSKVDFLISMNAVCSAVDAQRQALPTPTGLTDFETIVLNLTGTMRLVPVLISQAERLIARTAERALLEKNWLALERADYAAVKPIADQMVAHSTARDAAAVEADANELAAAPNHSSAMQTFLEGFGLASCAHLHAAE